MKIEFDPVKDDANRRKHGVSLAAVAGMDFEQALVVPDDRRDYDEARFRAIAPIGDRLHVLAFTMRGGGVLRPISLRRANARERKRYEQRPR